jgi:hypothetical protein
MMMAYGYMDFYTKMGPRGTPRRPMRVPVQSAPTRTRTPARTSVSPRRSFRPDPPLSPLEVRLARAERRAIADYWASRTPGLPWSPSLPRGNFRPAVGHDGDRLAMSDYAASFSFGADGGLARMRSDAANQRLWERAYAPRGPHCRAGTFGGR